MDATIYHNPDCGTSRNTLALIRAAGIEPTVVEYLKTPPSRDGLAKMIAEAGLARLTPSLEGAVATVTEVLRSLEELRNGPAEVEVAASPTAIEPRTPGEERPRTRAPSTVTCMPDCRPNAASAPLSGCAGMSKRC